MSAIKVNKEIDLINKNYEKLKKKLSCNGVSTYKKIDLHIHSLASKCYVRANKQNNEYEEYKLLIERMIESNIDIFAITDHNNINGYENIRRIILETEDYKEKLKNKLILPGIEIDCYGNHFLAIFSDEISLDKIKNFIISCGLENRDIPQSADRVTPLLLCEKVHELNGIVILAHADASKGFLEAYFNDVKENEKKDETNAVIIGTSIKKVLSHKALMGISINNVYNKKRCLELLKNWQIGNKKILQFSDSHSSLIEYNGSGKSLGERNSFIKIGDLSFNALVNSLKQINDTVFFEIPEEIPKTHIMGLAVQGGFLINNTTDTESFAIFPFSAELNCIIGARGTGKSTLLEIIDYIFNFEKKYDEYVEKKLYSSPYEDDYGYFDGRIIINRFEKSILYLKYLNDIYAIYINPEDLKYVNISIFTYNNDKQTFLRKAFAKSVSSQNMNKVIKIREKLRVKIFKQKDMQDLTSNKQGVFELIDDLNRITFGLDYKNLKHNMRIKANQIKDISKVMIKERKEDEFADYSNNNIEKVYEEYFKLYDKYISYFETNIKSINERLDKKMILDYNISLRDEDLYEIFATLEKKYRRIHGSSYDKFLKDSRDFRACLLNIISDCPQILFLIFTHNIEKIYSYTKNSNFCISKKSIENMVNLFWRCLEENDITILPLPIVDFKLNVAYGTKKQINVEREKLSFGQKTVGALLLIIYGTTKSFNNIPLIIDQPEDDLDNSYIYIMLIKQFNEIKNSKQLILATHNPNIPVCGEAENILVLESNGKNGWLQYFGTIDNKKVANSVLKILEGDFEAFKRRADVYGFELHQNYLKNERMINK